MYHSVCFRESCGRHFVCKILFLCLWLFGMVMGICLSVFAGDTVFLLMRGVDFPPVTIVGLLSVFAFPFLITTLVVYLDKSWLLFPAVLIKAVCFGFCTGSIQLVYGRADWLVRLFLMFSDLCMTPVFLWLWLCLIGSKKARSFKTYFGAMIFAVLIGCVDYCVISPLLVLI